MGVHLDIAVDDLEAGVAWALKAGATLAVYQPQDDVRVMLDPCGRRSVSFEVPSDSGSSARRQREQLQHRGILFA
jgi:hypothetical protein